MILITGATGKIGAEILKRITARGEVIRAMTRHHSGQLHAANNSRPEVTQADFDDAPSLRRALVGVQRAFLVTNSSERVGEQQLRFIALAREAGLRHIVYLSQLHASASASSRFLRYHAAVEEALRDSGISFTMLRPNLYMQGLLMVGPGIVAEGKLYAPAAASRVSIVDVRDVAAVAVAALTQKQHAGKTYDITGPEALTHDEMASHLSSALNRPVEFVNVSEQAFREALLGQHMPEWQADGLVEDYAHYRCGEAANTSSSVWEATNAVPHSFRAFAQDYRSAFLEMAQHAGQPVS